MQAKPVLLALAALGAAGASHAADDPALARILVVTDYVGQCKQPQHEAPIAFLATALQIDWYRRPGHDRRANVIVADLYRHMTYVPDATATPGEVPDLRLHSRDPVLQRKKDILRASWTQAVPQVGQWLDKPRLVLAEKDCAALAASAVAEGAAVLDRLPPRPEAQDVVLQPMWKLVQAVRLNTSCKQPTGLPSLNGAPVVEAWAQGLPEAARGLWAEDAESVELEGESLAELGGVAEVTPTLPAGSPLCKDAGARIKDYLEWQSNWTKAK